MAKSLKGLRSEKSALEKRMVTAQAKVDEIQGLMSGVDSQIAEHEERNYAKAARLAAEASPEVAKKIMEMLQTLA